MSSNREKLREEVRFYILRLLHENPNISSRALAFKVGISNGNAYYCLNSLIEKGFVKLGNFSGEKNKRKYAYLLTPRGIKEKSLMTITFLKRKTIEYENLKLEIDALQDEINGEKIEAL